MYYQTTVGAVRDAYRGRRAARVEILDLAVHIGAGATLHGLTVDRALLLAACKGRPRAQGVRLQFAPTAAHNLYDREWSDGKALTALRMVFEDGAECALVGLLDAETHAALALEFNPFKYARPLHHVDSNDLFWRHLREKGKKIAEGVDT